MKRLFESLGLTSWGDWIAMLAFTAGIILILCVWFYQP